MFGYPTPIRIYIKYGTLHLARPRKGVILSLQMIFYGKGEVFHPLPFYTSYRIPNASLPASHLRSVYISIFHLFIGCKALFRPIKTKKTCAFYSNAFKVEKFFSKTIGEAARISVSG